MGYVRKTLSANEDYLLRARFNWTYNFDALAWLAVGLAPGLIWANARMSAETADAAATTALLWIAAAAFAAGALYCASRMVVKWTTVIAITTTRLIYKTGLIGRISHDISIGKVEEVDLIQSFFGRLFGYGKLTVGGEGIGLLELPTIDDPAGFRRVLVEAVTRFRRGATPQASERPPDAALARAQSREPAEKRRRAGAR